MIPVQTDLQQIPSDFAGGSVAIGNFDGVHRGHAELIQRLVQQAKRRHSPAIILTFDPPPIALLKPEVPLQPPITPIGRRAELLGELGVDGLVVLPTNMQLLNLTPQQFFQQVLMEQLQVQGMVEGPNFRFGKDRAGDTELLRELCNQHGVELAIVEATIEAEEMISSSRIRKLLGAGNVDAANALLTRPFQISGLVAPGAGRGREMMVPTANLIDVQSLIPAQGVYGGIVELAGTAHRAAIHIGPNPTFGETHTKIELHLIGFQGDLYGQTVSCDLLTRVRDTRQFNSRDELLNQIRSDVSIIISRVSLG